MKLFYHLVTNNFLANVINNFVWFAILFWAYLETQSVLTTSLMGGIYLVFTALSGFWFGSLVDHHKKKSVMLFSSFASLAFYLFCFIFYVLMPKESFTSVSDPALWILIIFVLAGAIMGNIRAIALSTLTTLLVEGKEREKANGVIGTAMGLAFAGSSIFSGLVLGFAGVYWVFLCAILVTLLIIGHLLLLSIPEKKLIQNIHQPEESSENTKAIDMKGTFKVILSIPGLLALLFFSTFNNFLGGVFMALMDAYGLSLVSVQNWGFILGCLSFSMIAGGIFISKKGLGKNPLRTLFQVNLIMWLIAVLFPSQPSIIFMIIGMFVWMALMPFAEATEQSIIQKVVPHNRQGRVFGFAQSMEQAASPLTAFLIGPIAEFLFIPFMTTGAGVELIGSWFGTGHGRGIALVFMAAGVVGFFVTLFSMRLKAYALLAEKYKE